MYSRKLTLCLLIWLAAASTPSSALDGLTVGIPLPDFELKDSLGITFTLADLKGHTSLLAYVRLDQQSSSVLLAECKVWLTEIAGLKIMAIAAESSTADSGAESGIPLLFDIDRRVYGEWGVRVFPSIVLVDSKGTVSKTNAGWSPGDRDDLRYELEVLTGARAREGVDSNLQILETGSEHDLALRHFHAGKQLWDEGLQERAREAWMSALKADSLCLEARLYLGRYYLRLGDIDSAQAHFQVANANKPSAESLRLLAQCRIQTGDLRKAEEYLEDALDLNRRSSDSKLALAEVYLLQGDLEESRSMVDEVMAMTKDNPRGYYLLGRIAETEGDLPAALEQYRRALQILALDH